METRLTPDQKIPGSIPGKLAFLFCFFFRTQNKIKEPFFM